MCRVSPEYELPRLDVPGGHGAPAHPLQPGDGEGETAARLLVQRLVLGRAETGGTVDILYGHMCYIQSCQRTLAKFHSTQRRLPLAIRAISLLKHSQ